MTFLQVSENVIRKSAEMAEKDPHGFIITLVSVSVVFAALILLYFAYSFIGMVLNGKITLKNRRSKDEKPSDEVASAIAMALDQEFNKSVHDEESYIITIRRQEYERI